jgi:hypothetical protein
VEKTPLHRDENSEKTTLSLDVAGFQLDQLCIEIDDHVLTISGERTNRLGDTFVTRRRFALQRGIYDEENVSATLEDGVLEVTIVKKPLSQSRKIPITVTSSSSTPASFLTHDAKSDRASSPSSEQNVKGSTAGSTRTDTLLAATAAETTEETAREEVLSVETRSRRRRKKP